jgi:hypothetical protein
VEGEFGARIAAGVAALTKDASREKPAAMRDSLDRILREPPEITMVKLADRTTNMAPPPHQWTESKIAAYRAEAELILWRRWGRPASRSRHDCGNGSTATLEYHRRVNRAPGGDLLLECDRRGRPPAAVEAIGGEGTSAAQLEGHASREAFG